MGIINRGEMSQREHGLNGNRVWVLIAKTVNLGNYESMRIEWGEGRTIDDEQDREQVRRKLVDDVLTNLMELISVVEETINE